MAKRYSPEFKDHGVRMVTDHLVDDRSVTQWQVVKEIAPSFGGWLTSRYGVSMTSIWLIRVRRAG